MVVSGEFPDRVEMIRQEDHGLNGKRPFGHFSFEGVVNSNNIAFFGQDFLALVRDQCEKEIPARLLGTPIVHGKVLGTLRFAQPTMTLFSIQPDSPFRAQLTYFLTVLASLGQLQMLGTLCFAQPTLTSIEKHGLDWFTQLGRGPP